MKARDVVGKRIVGVKQEYVASTPARSGYWDVHALLLDDGTRLIPITLETELGCEYAHTFAVNTTNKTKRVRKGQTT